MAQVRQGKDGFGHKFHNNPSREYKSSNCPTSSLINPKLNWMFLPQICFCSCIPDLDLSWHRYLPVHSRKKFGRCPDFFFLLSLPLPSPSKPSPKPICVHLAVSPLLLRLSTQSCITVKTVRLLTSLVPRSLIALRVIFLLLWSLKAL